MFDTRTFLLSRLEIYEKFINQFDILDYQLYLLYTKCNVVIESKLLNTNSSKDVQEYTDLLLLDWNCGQRFLSNTFNDYQRTYNFCYLNLNNRNFWLILDNCLDVLFLDKDFSVNINKTDLVLNISQSSYWYYFFPNLSIINYFLKKSVACDTQIKINYYNKLFVNLHRIPHNFN